MHTIYTTGSEEETYEFGRAIASLLSPGDSVLLKGDLGIGKSVLARGIARGLGVTQPMPSPSFTMMIPYMGKIPVYHYDLYRLNGIDEFYEAGLDENIGSDGVSLIEWPQTVDLDVEPALLVSITMRRSTNERRFLIEGKGLPDYTGSMSRWREKK